MERAQKNKKIWIISSIILLLIVAIILVALFFGKGKNENETDGNEPGREIIIDQEKESENGLDVAPPEEADKKDSSNGVEFTGPGGKPSSSDSAGNGEPVGDDKGTEQGGANGNLVEKTENDSSYGEFY